MSRQNIIFLLLALSIVIGAANQFWPTLTATAVPQNCQPPSTHPKMIAIAGGTLIMGSDDHYAEEAPRVQVQVAPFAISETEITNAQFSAFVDATGYRTLAQRGLDRAQYPGMPDDYYTPASLVFVPPGQIDNLRDIGQWWQLIEGADWQHPEGPNSSIKQRMHHPVVHIAYEDAHAYAQWIGHDLPTEAEWEWAARGGLANKPFTWGDEAPTSDAPKANHWQGVFPLVNLDWDGFNRTAPVGCFGANGYGLFDMAGNVWEWTTDQYAAGQERVIKGGSFLCADNFCGRYRPAARQPGAMDSGTSHIGFRTILR